MRGGREQQEMVARITEQLAQGIPCRLAGRRGPGHPVGFVNDHKVPVNLLEAGEDLCPLRQVERGDDLILV